MQTGKRYQLLCRITLLMTALALAVGGGNGFAYGKIVSETSTQEVLFYLGQKQAFVGDEEVLLNVAPTIFDDRTYVPVRFLGEVMGFPVDWIDETRTIVLSPPGHHIVIQADEGMVWLDSEVIPFESVVRIVDGTLLARLTWLADLLQIPYSYDSQLHRVEMMVTRSPDGIYIPVPEPERSDPVAIFTTAKSVYRPGEQVKYIDLSYHPDGEGIYRHQWIGNEEVFFRPGVYQVELQVTDYHGNVSDVYRDYVKVEGSIYATEFEYPFYTRPVGSFVPMGWSAVNSRFTGLPELDKQVSYDTERKLLVSDSPEEITEPGILYRDTVSGKVRLYAHHINGADRDMTLYIYATNHSAQPVKLTTTNKGEVASSIYALLIGSEGTVDFLLDNKPEEELVIPSGAAVVYKQVAQLRPGQGTNAFYDFESDGALEISFVAQVSGTEVSLEQLPGLTSDSNVRGTFPAADIIWNVDMNGEISRSMKLTIGDNNNDVFLEGTDALAGGIPRVNYGNWGVRYHIHIENPGKMAVLLLARGGHFKGPFKINGEMMKIPQSGILTAFDNVVILTRTTGLEGALDIEFSPPGGSSFPVDLIFYPLRELE